MRHDTNEAFSARSIGQGIKAMFLRGVREAEERARGMKNGIRRKIQTMSPAGRALGAVALTGVVVFGFLMIGSADFSVRPKNVLIVTRQSVNVRSADSVKGKVVGEVARGDELIPLRNNNGWWRVRVSTTDVEGWVHEDTVRVKHRRTLVMLYPIGSYELYFLGSVGLFLVALNLRPGRRLAQVTPLSKVG